MKVKLLLLIIIFILCTIPGLAQDKSTEVAKLDGVGDRQQGKIKLDGQWEFYWQQLLTPTQFQQQGINPERYMDLPRSWNDYQINEQKLGAYGYATFRKTISLEEDAGRKAIKIPQIYSAYKLWVNNKLIAEAGQVAANSKDFAGDYKSKVVYFLPRQSEIELVLQVTNYGERMGGVIRSLELGSAELMRRERKKKLALEMFLFGSLLMMAIYHFSLYYFRRNKLAPLYLGLFCFLIALRTLLVGEIFLVDIIKEFDYHLQIKLEYLTFFLPLPVILSFVNQLFPEENYYKVIKISWIVGIIFSLAAVILPVKYSNLTLPTYRVFAVLGLFYMLYVVGRAVIRKRDGANLFAVGLGIITLGIINDLCYYIKLSPLNNLTSLALVIFIFFQSLNLARNYSNAFQRIESLSQRLISLDKLKDEFLANTSHELKTPLNGIIGIAESMLDGAAGDLTVQQRNNLNLIANSGDRLSNLVNDILDFSKLKNNDLAINSGVVDIYQVLELVLEMSQPLVQNQAIELVNKVSPQLTEVYADENRVKQILYNLIGNAIKFTQQGTITICAVEQKEAVKIQVIDTGIGIPEASKDQIFNSFEQVNASDSREFNGTGLGLSITKKLVELQGGEITVESEVGVGSEFAFTVPKYQEQKINSEAETEFTPHLVTETASMSGLNFASAEQNQAKILIADDDNVNRQVLSNHLFLENYEVTVVNNGLEVLSVLEKEDYDLLILDIMMPKLSGYEVAHKIREEYSRLELPILMLTAKNQTKDIVASFKAGANDHLPKPFAKDELLARVTNLLELKKAVSRSIEQMQNLEAERQQRLVAEKLHNIMNQLTSSLELETVIKHLLSGVEKIFAYHSALVLLKQEGELSPVLTSGNIKEDIDYAQLPIVQAVKEELEPLLKSENKLFTTAETNCLALPLVYQNKLLGICVLESDPAANYTTEDKKISSVLSSQGGVAVKNALLFEQLTEKTKSLENLLDNTGQGFLSCGRDLVVDDEYSQECEEIFATTIAGAKLPELIFPKQPEKKQFLSDIIPEILTTADYQKYLDLLPQEVIINKQHVELDFKVIEKEQEQKLMLILTDVTEKKAMAAEVEQEKNNLKKVVKAVTSYEQLMSLVRQYQAFFAYQWHDILAEENLLEVKLEKICRRIHTYKGSLTQFYCLDLAAELDAFEDQLEELLETADSISVTEVEALFKEFDYYQPLAAEFALLKETLGQDFFQEQHQVTVNREQLLSLENKIREKLSAAEQEELLPAVQTMRYQSLGKLLEPYQAYVEQLVQQTDKQVEVKEVVIEDNGLQVDPLIYGDLIDVIGHIFRNSIEHGLETVATRKNLSKGNQGLIECRAVKEEQQLKLTIKDDGAGLDLEKIKAKAVEEGLYTSKEINQLPEEEIKRLIFADSFSTAKQVTQLSGRGIGLAAVKEAVADLGGRIEVASQLGAGTKFELQLPASGVFN